MFCGNHSAAEDATVFYSLLGGKAAEELIYSVFHPYFQFPIQCSPNRTKVCGEFDLSELAEKRPEFSFRPSCRAKQDIYR
jgi:hypothetical protein